MAAKGYATHDDVAAYLGLTFTSPQNTQADALIEAAESYVDRTTGRAWKVGASVVEDHFGPLNGPYVWLDGAPINGVTSITRRSSMSDPSPFVLVAGTDYEVQDLATGRLWLAAWAGYDRLGMRDDPFRQSDDPFRLSDVRFRVTYTTANTVDADIALATKMLVAHWMRPLLEQVGTGIQSYSVGGELSVTYQQAAADRGVPSEVDAILRARTRLVIA